MCVGRMPPGAACGALIMHGMLLINSITPLCGIHYALLVLHVFESIQSGTAFLSCFCLAIPSGIDAAAITFQKLLGWIHRYYPPLL